MPSERGGGRRMLSITGFQAHSRDICNDIRGLLRSSKMKESNDDDRQDFASFTSSFPSRPFVFDPSPDVLPPRLILDPPPTLRANRFEDRHSRGAWVVTIKFNFASSQPISD